MWAGQEFRREIGDDARFLLDARFQGPHALLVDAIPNGECQGGVNVVGRCCHGYPPKAAEEIVEKRLPEIGNAHAGPDAHTGRECARFQAEGLARRHHRSEFLVEAIGALRRLIVSLPGRAGTGWSPALDANNGTRVYQWIGGRLVRNSGTPHTLGQTSIGS